MSNNQSQESTIYDLHVTGLGSLFRVREVLPKPGRRGSSFWACNVKAIHGDKNSPVCVPFDVSIVGTRALEVVKRLQHHANDRDTHVVIGFKIGDMYPDSYPITKGDRNGQLAHVLRGRLLQVRWAKVDGEMVYSETWDEDKEEFVGEFVDGFDDQPADDPAPADDRVEQASQDRAPTSQNNRGRYNDRRSSTNGITDGRSPRRQYHDSDDIPY
ncbi:DUF3577 domain-containing protein [Robbsia andropogonis]|uniref:DUF3577 domain-containing protein n=1 Tax=Robbsia andropogonis TaxID=28092 RepID=UPI00158ACDBA|nr:DUF3577 domain-containing protein [Robbsia andropogonis]